MKIFHGERLDFIDERIKKKEILLFLMSKNTTGNHIDLMESMEPLELAEDQIPQYINALLDDSTLSVVGGEIDELYIEVENVGERLQFIDIIDNENISYEYEEEA